MSQAEESLLRGDENEHCSDDNEGFFSLRKMSTFFDPVDALDNRAESRNPGNVGTSTSLFQNSGNVEAGCEVHLESLNQLKHNPYAGDCH